MLSVGNLWHSLSLVRHDARFRVLRAWKMGRIARLASVGAADFRFNRDFLRGDAFRLFFSPAKMANHGARQRFRGVLDFAPGRNWHTAVLTKLRAMSDLASQLLQRTPPLVPKSVFDAEISRKIGAQPLPHNTFALCERAGLLLWNDDLDGAHTLIQDEPNSTASFWHAILHRREGDFSNANYWWRRTGKHEVFDEICDVVLHRVPEFPFLDELRASGAWEPQTFTDFCQKAHQNGDWKANCEAVQRLEMRLLLEWCAAKK